MKAVQVLVCLLFLASEGVLDAAHGAFPSRPQFAGKNYIRLDDWARNNQFDVRWLAPGETLRLTSRSARLEFSKDSRDALFNGIKVCLSYPIVVQNGIGYISRTDLDTAVHPVLAPPKGWRSAKIRNIVLDPGHGGKDPGNQSGSRQEKKYALLLAQEVGRQLSRAGFNPSLTRTTDEFIDLPVRPDLARRRNADLFISLHWNDLPGNSDVNGAQVYCLTPVGASSSNAGGEIIDAGHKPGNRNDEKNMLLAYTLQKSLVQGLGIADRGVRRARYEVLRDAVMPAVLIEGGFMSSPADARRIYDATFRERMARAIVDGILAYARLLEK